MIAALPDWIESQLCAAPAPAVQEFAAHLAARGHGSVLAVLFYGSGLRSGDLADGLLDFYVLVDRLRDWHGPGLAALANRLLPPNVFYQEQTIGTQQLRAKIAVLSLEQFQQGMHADSLDTTLWARFSQPVMCAWSRDAAALKGTAAALAQAAVTAASWAARLGPASATAQDYWRSLFQRTYATELRVERGERAQDVLGFDPTYYDVLLPMAWNGGGIHFQRRADGLRSSAAGFARKVSRKSAPRRRTARTHPMGFRR